MNSSLVRLHRAFYLGYLVGFLLLVLAILISPEGEKANPIAFFFAVAAPFFTLHYLAAIGARRGERWGRNLSRVIGCVMLVGIPIGTIIGAFILSKTGNQWESGSKEFQSNFVQN